MAFKMSGFSAFTKQTMQGKPTDDSTTVGGDEWRKDFLKKHNVTNSQVNAEIARIGGGEDDIDFEDWKKTVINLSKKNTEGITTKD
jgi:hypothetical protein